MTEEHHLHDEHAHHPAHLGHHWKDSQQQFEAGKLGMWLFLATEVLLFGGLFVGYAVWRGNNPDLFEYGSRYLDTNLGAINTAVLILSSLTMALAVTYAQLNKQRALVTCLILTFIGACGFMLIKYIEYTDKFREGLYPGAAFYDGPKDRAESKYWVEGKPLITRDALIALRQADDPTTGLIPTRIPDPVRPLPQAEVSAVRSAAIGPSGMGDDPRLAYRPREQSYPPAHPLQDPDRPVNAHMFFNIYFMMTGLHGIHVLVGMIVIGWITLRAIKGEFTSAYYTPVDLGGLYWHIVDLIWIFLFPLFYLI
jgi:cytochrome c oxidase subunit 3